MSERKNPTSSFDYRLLVEEELREELSEDNSQPSSSTSSSSLRSLHAPWHVFRIPFRHAIRITLSFPLFAFTFAIAYAMVTNYDMAVNVICSRDHDRKVRNYLPSLSAAIGDFPFSQTVWTLAIVIHAPPRFLFSSMYLDWFEASIPPNLYKWAYVAYLLSVFEIVGLVGLSVITSRMSLPIHAMCFTTFLICSELYMFLQCYLQSHRKKMRGPSFHLENKSLQIKKLLSNLILLCTLVLVYTYHRHETYCERGVYTIFAGVEYVIILGNMAFHGCSFWDFYDRVIVIDFCRPFMSPNSGRLAWEI